MKRILLAVALAAPSVAMGYAFKLDSSVPARKPVWPAASNVVFTLGADRSGNIAAGTDVMGSLTTGLQVWEEPSGLRIDVVSGPSGLQTAMDGQNAITFADTAANRDALGEFHAVTLIWWDGNARITEADIIYRRDTVTFGDAADNEAYLDLVGLTAHEAGHALGMEHTAIQSATMFPYGGEGQYWRRALDADDILGARHSYGRALPGRGTLSGQVLRNGSPVFQAHVVAEQNGRPVASAITLHDGNYAITSLPPGSYQLYAEPLDGPFYPAALTGGEWDNTTGAGVFLTTYAINGNTLTVTAGGNAETNISVGTGASPNIMFATPSTDGTSFAGRGPYAVSMAPGATGSIALIGNGLDAVTDGNFTMGSGFSVTAVTARGMTTTNLPFAILSYAVSGAATPGARTIFAENGSGQQGTMTGALIVRACPELGGSDPDADDVCGSADNCASVNNPGQEDRDSDGTGDLCDECPDHPFVTGVCGGASSASSVGNVSSSAAVQVSSTGAASSSTGGATSRASSTGNSTATSARLASGGRESSSLEAGAGGDEPGDSNVGGCASQRVRTDGAPGLFLAALLLLLARRR